MIMADQTQQPPSENVDQFAEPTEKDQQPKKGQVGDVEFERINKFDLKAVPVIVQALDNQWLPRFLLKQAQQKGQVTGGIDRELGKAVRAEYTRSLINGQQLIINRAFLYNNPAISQDYMNIDSQERKAFKALLGEATIVPYFLSEQTPIERPIYEIQEEAFARWQE